jgi:hypothetical protein
LITAESKAAGGAGRRYASILGTSGHDIYRKRRTRVGRPPLGLKLTNVRLSAETIARIRRFEKNVSAYVRGAVEEKLKKDEKKADKSED